MWPGRETGEFSCFQGWRNFGNRNVNLWQVISIEKSEVSEAVKAFLQKITEQMHPEVGVYLQTEDWNDDDAHPNYVEMSTRRTLRFILQVLNYVCIYMV